MSINESQYKIDIKALQNALKMIASTPNARLEIKPGRVALVIQGEYAWIVHGREEVAKVLARTADRFFETMNDAPVEPVLDISDSDIEQIVREMPFAYRDAIGRIFQSNKGWSGEFTLKNLQVKLQKQFNGPAMVESKLMAAVDSLGDHLFDPFLAPDTHLEEDMDEFTEEDRDEDIERNS